MVLIDKKKELLEASLGIEYLVHTFWKKLSKQEDILAKMIASLDLKDYDIETLEDLEEYCDTSEILKELYSLIPESFLDEELKALPNQTTMKH